MYACTLLLFSVVVKGTDVPIGMHNACECTGFVFDSFAMRYACSASAAFVHFIVSLNCTHCKVCYMYVGSV